MSGELAAIVLPAADDVEVHPLYLRAHGGVRITGRRGVVLSEGAAVSFGTYFNAFPAAYWAHSTSVGEVGLAVSITGSAVVRVWRSDAAGVARIVAEEVVDNSVHTVGIDISGMSDGGWLWFDVAANTTATVTDAAWTTAARPRRPARSAVGITTFNKPDFAAATLGAIAAADELRPHLERVIVVDQGDRRVCDEPSFPATAEMLGDVLSVIGQDNLGGSGGYARAMIEARAIADAEFVMLIDDDVQVEPEAIRRAIVFGSYCTEPTIVGGHMIDLLDRTKLYAWAEVVATKPFMWHPRHEDQMPMDLAEADLPATPLLHQRMDADYNGWWMCLIPRRALEDVGLPLPAFIKWDDAEYSLRAAGHGISTVSLPGVALWHVSWVGKNDLIDWQAYFHARNRIVAALLHSEEPRGGTLLTHSRRVDVKHLLAMQHYPVALRHRALEAILSGPEHMHPDLRAALPSARSLASGFPETLPARVTAADTEPAWTTDDDDMPTGLALRLFMVATLGRLWLHRPRRSAALRAEISVHARQAKWWRLARFDSALVRMAGSETAHLFVRDRAAYRRLTLESIRLHRRLRREWASLAAWYRAADVASAARWYRTLGLPAQGELEGGTAVSPDA